MSTIFQPHQRESELQYRNCLLALIRKKRKHGNWTKSRQFVTPTARYLPRSSLYIIHNARVVARLRHNRRAITLRPRTFQLLAYSPGCWWNPSLETDDVRDEGDPLSPGNGDKLSRFSRGARRLQWRKRSDCDATIKTGGSPLFSLFSLQTRSRPRLKS